MSVRAQSFDVFDTCLVRTWARPVDVLYAVADRVAPGPRGAPGREELVSELVRLRMAAEQAQMDRLGVEAVVLEQVYADADAFRALGVDPAALLAAELETERASLRPVRAGAERVAAARAAGLRVIFVSDMYLPAAEIRAGLERFGIAAPGDPLYVSGELGISKFTGRLFSHVLEQEGLRPDELVHHGDDPVTDDTSPALLGVGVRPLLVGRLNRHERAAVEHPAASRAVGARLGGVARAARVAAAPEEGAAAATTAVAAGVVAPLFCAFVAWTLRLAREEGIERLHFVSRDAQIMLAIARVLRRDGDPECRYLFGSRQAWFLPGVHAVDRGSLWWTTQPEGSLRTPRTLLAKLELTPEELAGPLARHRLGADEHLDGGGLERFWAVLEASAPVVLERAAEARGRLQRYLAQEGLHDDRRWALVDLGWRLTAQAALRRVLAEEGRGEAVLGLYLGLGRNRAPLAETGPFRAFVLQDDGRGPERRPGDWLFTNTSFVEQVFAMADHGSCTGYREVGGRVEPVLREQREDPARDAYVRGLHETVVGFAREAAATGLLDDLEAVRAVALSVARSAVQDPTREEARALGALRVSDDQNETRVRELAAPLTARDVATLAGSRLRLPVRRDFGTERVWREGSLRLSTPVMRGMFGALRTAGGLARSGRARARRASVRRSRG